MNEPVDLITRLEGMLAKGTDNALLRFSLGQACLNDGRAAEAAEHLRKATEHDAGYSAAWKLLGRALAAADRPAEAIEVFERGIGIAEEKGDRQAAKEMGVFLRRLKK